MKKFLSTILILAITFTSHTAFGINTINAKAAVNFDSPQTNISISTAAEIANNTFSEGSFSKNDPYHQRWYKFTNPYNTAAVVQVTLSKRGGDVWPNYSFYDKKGKAEEGLCYSGSFTSGGTTVNVGLNAGETKYLKISKDSAWSLAWTTSITISPEEANTIKTSRTAKSGKTLYGSLNFAGDEDVFKIKAKKSGKMKITVSNNDIGGLFDKFEYTVYNKSKVAKKTGRIDPAKSDKYTITVKKGQVVYIKVRCTASNSKYLGDYVIKTKIK